MVKITYKDYGLYDPITQQDMFYRLISMTEEDGTIGCVSCFCWDVDEIE